MICRERGIGAENGRAVGGSAEDGSAPGLLSARSVCRRGPAEQPPCSGVKLAPTQAVIAIFRPPPPPPPLEISIQKPSRCAAARLK